MGTTALNIVKCPGRAKQKFLEVQEPFFKKVPGRRRQKQKSESTINNFNPPTIVRVCPCLSVANTPSGTRHLSRSIVIGPALQQNK